MKDKMKNSHQFVKTINIAKQLTVTIQGAEQKNSNYLKYTGIFKVIYITKILTFFVQRFVVGPHFLVTTSQYQVRRVTFTSNQGYKVLYIISSY